MNLVINTIIKPARLLPWLARQLNSLSSTLQSIVVYTYAMLSPCQHKLCSNAAIQELTVRIRHSAALAAYCHRKTKRYKPQNRRLELPAQALAISIGIMSSIIFIPYNMGGNQYNQFSAAISNVFTAEQCAEHRDIA